jgi:hypothetical protein
MIRQAKKMISHLHQYNQHHQDFRRGADACDLYAADNDEGSSSTSSTMATASSQYSSITSVSFSTSSLPQQDNPQDDEDVNNNTIVRKRRVVRFDETLNKEYANTSMCSEDCRFLWYNSKQLQAFNDSNYAHAQELLESGKKKAVLGRPISYKRLLRLTYRACCRAGDNGEGADLAPSQLEDLEFLFSHLDLRGLGMERMVARANARDIQLRRMEMTSIILQLELSSTDDSSAEDHDKAEMIRARCQALSRPARLYARHLAQALAAYVAAMENNSLKDGTARETEAKKAQHRNLHLNCTKAAAKANTGKQL